MVSVEKFIEHHGIKGQKWGVTKAKISVSDTPWSQFKASDYTREQWHNASLIHQHEGPPTSKNDCKLPVKEPSGIVNRNGVHAAAGVLAGSRGGVKASPQEKDAAAKALLKLYEDMGDNPPASLLNHSFIVENFLEHYGKKGMRWGVRKASTKTASKQSGDYKEVAKLRKKKVSELSTKQLKKHNERVTLEMKFNQMNPTRVKKGHDYVKAALATATLATTAYNLFNSNLGKHLMSLGNKRINQQMQLFRT